MLKKTGALKDNWQYKIVQKDKLILIVFSNGEETYKVEECMELAGFGIEDYSIPTLQYMLDDARGILDKNIKFNPIKH